MCTTIEVTITQVYGENVFREFDRKLVNVDLFIANINFFNQFSIHSLPILKNFIAVYSIIFIHF